MPIISLLTDFGTADNYVGVMKAVILGRCPGAQLVDISHRVPAQDVAAGAFLLDKSWQYFAAGSVHLAVVDPGVGTQRRGLVAAAGGHLFVAPDNGLLSPVLQACPTAACYSIENTDLMLQQRARTFHGRDVFSPVAAALARGVAVDTVGPPIDDPVLLPATSCERSNGRIDGTVVYIDRYGNLVTNIPEAELEAAGSTGELRAALPAAGVDAVPVVDHYQAVEPGGLLAVVGGFGNLEISVRDASARERLDAERGWRVSVTGATA